MGCGSKDESSKVLDEGSHEAHQTKESRDVQVACLERLWPETQEILRRATEDVGSILRHNAPAVSLGYPKGDEEQPVWMAEEKTEEIKIGESQGSLVIKPVGRGHDALDVTQKLRSEFQFQLEDTEHCKYVPVAHRTTKRSWQKHNQPIFWTSWQNKGAEKWLSCNRKPEQHL